MIMIRYVFRWVIWTPRVYFRFASFYKVSVFHLFLRLLADYIKKGTEYRNNFFFFSSHGHALCKRPALFPVRCVIAMNVRPSSLISTTIILSLCACHNYNHLPHNYNFKTLYRGASFWQGNNWWEGNGDVCIPGMARLDEGGMVPRLVNITNIKTCIQYKNQTLSNFYKMLEHFCAFDLKDNHTLRHLRVVCQHIPANRICMLRSHLH